MEIFANGRTRFFIPLQRINIINDKGIISNDVKSKNIRDCLEKCSEEDKGLYLLKFFDLNRLWQITVMMTNFYLNCIKEHITLIHDFRIAVRGSNLWRTVGFVDHDRWAERVQTFHLPVIAGSVISLPETIKSGIMIDIFDNGASALWGALVQLIGAIFGFSLDILLDLISAFIKDSIEE